MDDDAFRQTTARVLGRHGCDTREAGSGSDARAVLYAEEDVSAALCDIRMPGESGLELLPHLAAAFPRMVVVMTTGVDDHETAQKAFQIGADGYLVKPFTSNELLITLTNALRRRQLELSRQSQLAAPPTSLRGFAV